MCYNDKFFKIRIMKKIFKKIIVVAIVVSLALETFATERIITGGVDSMIDDGPGAMTEVLVAGDSYAQRFYEDEKDRELRLFPYFNEGHSIEENWEILFDAFTTYKKMLFLSISVNDRHRNTHPSVFENELRNLFAVTKMTKKYVFVHSYMYYDLSCLSPFQFTTAEYDAMIRKVIMEFPDTVYFIDMSDCVGAEYGLADGLHYNKKFNDTLYDRLLFMIDYIKGKNKNE